jgi:hypothetical protein
VQVDTDPAVTTVYHIDPQNHTGYAKAIEEIVGGALERSYAIGHAIISQAASAGAVVYLLHDGHGSTRALVDALAQVVERYAYDAYGTTLQGVNVTLANLAQTTWLFAGDGQYDPASGLTNHIKRWRKGAWFLTDDDFTGDNFDPISLHKYLYTHGNPIAGLDPSGEFLAAITTAFSNVGWYAWGLTVRYPGIALGASIALAGINFIAFATSAEFREFYVASAGGPGPAVQLLAADLRVLVQTPRVLTGFGSAAAAENVVTLRYNTGDLHGFWRKAGRLQNTANAGGLTVVTDTKSIRIASAQATYRDAVTKRSPRTQPSS